MTPRSGDISSPLWKTIIAALVRSREPRGVWLYAICAILVVLYALSVLYGIGAEATSPRLRDFVIPALWLSVPVAIALVQVWRQTLLGWLLLLAGFAGPALGMCYWLINERLVEPWPLLILAILTAMCAGLVRHRPTRPA
jgi:peptidoglycan/LPS O-acetylase OafA/YrhL